MVLHRPPTVGSVRLSGSSARARLSADSAGPAALSAGRLASDASPVTHLSGGCCGPNLVVVDRTTPCRREKCPRLQDRTAGTRPRGVKRAWRPCGAAESNRASCSCGQNCLRKARKASTSARLGAVATGYCDSGGRQACGEWACGRRPQVRQPQTRREWLPCGAGLGYASSVMATVPATMSAKPSAARRVSVSLSTSHAKATETRMDSLSICTTTLTTPVWIAR